MGTDTLAAVEAPPGFSDVDAGTAKGGRAGRTGRGGSARIDAVEVESPKRPYNPAQEDLFAELESLLKR